MFALILTGILLSLIAIALVVAVLLQNPKDEGGNIWASNNPIRQIVGVAEIPHILHKVTYFLLAFLLIGTIIFSYLLHSHYSGAGHEDLLG